MDLLLSYIPWQIQVLILSIVVLAMIPNIIKMSKRVPKMLTVACSTLTLAMIDLIFIRFAENMGDSIGITSEHVDILFYIMIC